MRNIARTILLLITIFLPWQEVRAEGQGRSVEITVRHSDSDVDIRSEDDPHPGRGGVVLETGGVLQSILVQEGQTASFSVGKILPFTTEEVVWSGRTSGVARSVEYREVDTGFSVRPRIVEDAVELRISARQSHADGETVDFQRTSTILRVTPGTWYNLSSQLEGGSGSDRGGRILRAGGSRLMRTLWIRVDL